MSIPANSAVAQLCPHCALCCNGVLFKDVELQPGDNAATLKSLGLLFTKAGSRRSAMSKETFPQPCAALDGCRCRIYADRPARCREFECALLKAVVAGETEVNVALRVIRDARQRAEKVRALLREAGDTDEQRPFSLRFKRTRKRFESSLPDDAAAEMFSRLTLAVHDLNLLLQDKFYPG
jgi:Fe-S-cluster containining protein